MNRSSESGNGPIRQAQSVALGNKVRSGGGHTTAADATFRAGRNPLELPTFDTTATLVGDEVID